MAVLAVPWTRLLGLYYFFLVPLSLGFSTPPFTDLVGGGGGGGGGFLSLFPIIRFLPFYLALIFLQSARPP